MEESVGCLIQMGGVIWQSQKLILDLFCLCFCSWIFLFCCHLRHFLLLLLLLLLKRQSIVKQNAHRDLANSKRKLLHSEMHSFYAAGAHTYANEYGARFRSSHACALPFLRLPPCHLPHHSFSIVFWIREMCLRPWQGTIKAYGFFLLFLIR